MPIAERFARGYFLCGLDLPTVGFNPLTNVSRPR